MTVCTEKCKKISAFSVGTSFLVLGMLTVIFWMDLYQIILENELVVKDGSKSYEMWKDTPIPMYLNIYLYNWTNAEEVQKDWTIKPKLEQCGPYVFLEHHERVDLKYNYNKTQIKYYQIRTWHYQESLSNGSLSDPITNLNVIASAVAYFVKDQSYIIKKFVNLFLNEKEKTMTITRTASQWMFEGFEDELLALAHKLNISGIGQFDKFGWFYARNTSKTYDGSFTMYTGLDDIELLGIIELWNDKSTSSSYNGYCGFINGTSGELWPPVKKYNKVDVFSPDVCSSVALFHNNNTPMVEGIEGKEYIGTDFIFDNGTKYPEQECFNGARVFPSGIRDVSKCKFGAPAFVSYPHFYLADPYYASLIEGMHPDPEKHKFVLALEPNTGVPLYVDAQLQINLFLEPISGITLFEGVKEIMMPMLWFQQTARMTSDLSGQIKMLLVLPDVGLYTGYGFIGIGILIFGISIYFTVRNGWKKLDEEQLLSEKSL